MVLIAIASDKGAPGVTTTALALAAVWPRPVLLAECDPAGGDLVYRFPAAGGGHLDPRRGVLSLAVAARRGMQPQQLWEHTQKLHGGLDVLAGVTNAEQGAGLSLLWGPIGKVLASLPQADVIADCGRLGADGPLYDLLAEATTVVLVTRMHVADVIRLRDRAIAFAAAAQGRGRRGFGVGVVAVADHKKFQTSLGEVRHVLRQANAPATVLGGIAHDAKGADLLSGEWGGNLDRTALIKTARSVARQLTEGLPPVGSASGAPAIGTATATGTGPQPAVPPSFRSPVGAPSAPSQPEVPPSFRPASAASSPAASAAPSAVSRSPAASFPGTAFPADTLPAAAHMGQASAVPSDSAQAGTRPPGRARSLFASAPRTTFSRVLGAGSGRHHSGQGPGGRSASAAQIPASPAPATSGPGTPSPTTPGSSTPMPSTPAAATPAAARPPSSAEVPVPVPPVPVQPGTFSRHDPQSDVFQPGASQSGPSRNGLSEPGDAAVRGPQPADRRPQPGAPLSPWSSVPRPGDLAPPAFGDPQSEVRPAHGPERPAGSGYTRTPMSPLTPSGADAASGAGVPSGAGSADTSRPPPDPDPGPEISEAGITEIPEPPEISEPSGTSGTPATPAVAERPDASSRRDQRQPNESEWALPSWPPTGPMDSSRSGGG